jgi:hypothetical protein
VLNVFIELILERLQVVHRHRAVKLRHNAPQTPEIAAEGFVERT